MNTVSSGYSDRGMVREGNEDSFVVAPELGLFAVADGVGGHRAGEIASKMALDVLQDYLGRTSGGGEVLLGGNDPNYSDTANRLASGIRLASRVIYESAQDNPAWRNMGTTIVAALLEEERLSIAHVGDSRAYLIRGGGIIPLTEDHSMIAEQVRMGLLSPEAAQASTQRNIITRALGFEVDAEVDLCDLLLAQEDRILLCSDGLTNMVSDQMICSIALGSQNPDEICQQLVEEANMNGGKDNVTAVLIMVRSGSLSLLSRMLDWARRS